MHRGFALGQVRRMWRWKHASSGPYSDDRRPVVAASGGGAETRGARDTALKSVCLPIVSQSIHVYSSVDIDTHHRNYLHYLMLTISLWSVALFAGSIATDKLGPNILPLPTKKGCVVLGPEARKQVCYPSRWFVDYRVGKSLTINQ